MPTATTYWRFKIFCDGSCFMWWLLIWIIFQWLFTLNLPLLPNYSPLLHIILPVPWSCIARLCFLCSEWLLHLMIDIWGSDAVLLAIFMLLVSRIAILRGGFLFPLSLCCQLALFQVYVWCRVHCCTTADRLLVCIGLLLLLSEFPYMC